MSEEKHQCLTIASPRISTLVQALFRQSDRNCSTTYQRLYQGPEADDEFGTVPDLQGAHGLLEEVGGHAVLSKKPRGHFNIIVCEFRVKRSA